ncbi:MAG: preprotein translocase subunit YajC [Flavobacteriales bacterium]|nr:preprotein translocase subunit YajC [Flavobacteriales bacterium]
MHAHTIILMGQGTEGGGTSVFIMWGLVLLIFYFFMIRPQQRKQKQAAAFRESLKKGSRVVTIGGIHGKVEEVKEKTVIMTTLGGDKLKVEKSAISPTAEASEADIAQSSK